MSVRGFLKNDYSHQGKHYYVNVGTSQTTTINTQSVFEVADFNGQGTSDSSGFVWSGASNYLRNATGKDLVCDISGVVHCTTAAKSVGLALTREVGGAGGYVTIDESEVVGNSGGELSFHISGVSLTVNDHIRLEVANHTDTDNLDFDVLKISVVARQSL